MDGSPVGELRSSLWFLAGSSLGGGLIALFVLWPISAVAAGLMSGVVQWTLGLIVVASVALGLRGVLSLPRIKRQVRQTHGDLSPSLGAFAFGVELGTGFRTYTSSPALYLIFVPALLSSPLTLLLPLGLAFGIVRGLVPLDRLARRDSRTWDEALQNRPWLLRLSPILGLVAAAAWVVVGV